MHGIACKTLDTAGGVQLAGQQDFVFVEGHLVVLKGDPVQPHGSGEHGGPVMAEGSPFVFINGIPVCREGHLATCGHASTGSSIVFLSE